MLHVLVCTAAMVLAAPPGTASEEGFRTLFDGRDLGQWKIPEGDNGHWKVLDGVIDYDALSEAKGEKHLWSEKEYKDFVLKVDWRIKELKGLYPVPTVLPDGTHKQGPDGKDIITMTP